MKTGLIALLLLSFSTFSQEKNYKVVSKTEKSDLNYKLFEQFGSTKIYAGGKIEKAFQPKKGKHIVYVFVAEYMGDSFDGTRKLFHDKLILKVDPLTNEVMDGFQYTMEWAEPPALSDLYRVTDNSIILTDKMNLDSLLMQVDDAFQGEYRDMLDDHGILIIN